MTPHRLTKDEAEAVTRLLSSADFRVFVDFLSRVAENHNEALIMQNFESVGKMYTLQGQTREVVTLIETITKAPSKLKELANPQR